MLKLFVTMHTMFIAGTDRLRGDNEKGATAVEYGIMVALIAVAIIASVTLFGTQLSTLFGTIRGRITVVP
jgi:pilus assembly protein Flp/PilA